MLQDYMLLNRQYDGKFVMKHFMHLIWKNYIYENLHAHIILILIKLSIIIYFVLYVRSMFIHICDRQWDEHVQVHAKADIDNNLWAFFYV